MNTSHRTAVITGRALYSSSGSGPDAHWNDLMRGKHAFSNAKRLNNPLYRNRLAGIAPGLGLGPHGTSAIPEELLDHLAPEAQKYPSGTELFLAETAGEIELLENPQRRCTCNSLLEKALTRFHKKTGWIISAACASSNTAIQQAASEILCGVREGALIASVEYVSEFVFSGFDSLNAMSCEPPCPYDKDRSGLLLGDCGALLALEEESAAKRNGHPALARIAGWGMSCDAAHITAPQKSGEGLLRAIRAALEKAGVSPGETACVIGHGTGTIYNDAMELAALQRIFPDGCPLVSVKGVSGHTLGAAGLVQALTALKIFESGWIPPQTGLKIPMDGAENFVSREPRKLNGKYILSLNSGFGGLNAVLLLENIQ